jgi:hypothetical protein
MAREVFTEKVDLEKVINLILQLSGEWEFQAEKIPRAKAQRHRKYSTRLLLYI